DAPVGRYSGALRLRVSLPARRRRGGAGHRRPVTRMGGVVVWRLDGLRPDQRSGGRPAPRACRPWSGLRACAAAQGGLPRRPVNRPRRDRRDHTAGLKTPPARNVTPMGDIQSGFDDSPAPEQSLLFKVIMIAIGVVTLVVFFVVFFAAFG